MPLCSFIISALWKILSASVIRCWSTFWVNILDTTGVGQRPRKEDWLWKYSDGYRLDSEIRCDWYDRILYPVEYFRIRGTAAWANELISGTPPWSNKKNFRMVYQFKKLVTWMSLKYPGSDGDFCHLKLGQLEKMLTIHLLVQCAPLNKIKSGPSCFIKLSGEVWWAPIQLWMTI